MYILCISDNIVLCEISVGDKLIMKKRLKTITYNLENSFYIHVIRHGLAMMIPILLTGGIANALLNLPIQAYQRLIEDSFLSFF